MLWNNSENRQYLSMMESPSSSMLPSVSGSSFTGFSTGLTPLRKSSENRQYLSLMERVTSPVPSVCGSSFNGFPTGLTPLREDQSTDESGLLSTEQKKKIKAALFRKAVSFKEEILKEMGEVKVQLQKDLKDVKSFSIYLKQDESERKVAKLQNNLDAVDRIEGLMKKDLKEVQKILNDVEKHEQKFAELKGKWDTFRACFKDQVIKAFKEEMEKRNDNPNPEDILDWSYFMPEIIFEGLNYGKPGATTMRVKYFE